MTIRQEVHWVGPDRLARAVTTQPDAVWAIRGEEGRPPALPFAPVHCRNAYLLDVGHDWSMRGPGGCLRYSPGGGASNGEWLLCEWEDKPREAKPKRHQAHNLAFADSTWETMQKRAAALGFGSVSAYVTHLVAKDAKSAGER